MAPKRRALIVGIDAYPDPYQLGGCVNDAEAWRRALGVKRFECQALYNDGAIRWNILHNLATLLAESKPGDVVAFVYSGHGTQLRDVTADEGDGWDEALCPVDSLETGGFLTDDDLRAAIGKAAPGVRVVVFADSCYSGTITRFAAGNLPRAGRRARYIRATPEMHRAFRDFRGRAEGVVTQFPTPSFRIRRAAALVRPEHLTSVSFSACLPTEVAYESPNGDGTSSGDFTRAATRVLATAGATLTRAGFLRRVLAAMGEDRYQTPTLDAAPGMERKTMWGATALG